MDISWRSVVTAGLGSFLIALVLAYGRKARPAVPSGIPGVSVLRYDGFVRGLGIAGLLQIAGIGVYAMLRPTTGGGWYVAVGLSVFALGLCAILVESFTVFLVDRDGVTRRRIIGKELRIQWADVMRVVLDRRLNDDVPKGSVRIIARNAKMTFSTWLSGRAEIADRLAEGAPAAALGYERDAILAELRRTDGRALDV